MACVDPSDLFPWKQAAFDFSAIPNDAVIQEVTVEVEWRSSLATAELTLGAQALLDGTPVGTETTESTNPSADTTASFLVADVDRAELDTLTVAARATRASGDPVTAFLDVVSVEVTYTLPLREFAYDANGSLLDDDAGTTYGYDALGRLTSVTGPGVAASYTLDGAGNRVAASIDGVTTNYDLDVRGLATVLSDGSRRFLPGMPAAGYEEAGVWVGGLTNAQSTVLGSGGSSGLVGSLTHFDAWGQPLGGGGLPTGPGYTGEWSDATGLVNLRFRPYDPVLQRFIGGDTFPGIASVPTTWNRFAYANANPLTYTDPTGHLGVAANVAMNIVPFIPGPGDIYSMFTAIIGYDPIGGYELAGWERAAAAIPFVNDLKRLGPIARAIANKVDDIGRRVGRTLDAAADRVRAGARALGGGDQARLAGMPRFTQRTASPKFGHGSVQGRTIGEVAGDLRSGSITPGALPVQVIMRNGEVLSLNTRSTLALRRAGIDVTDWKIHDVTGDTASERLLTERLRSNQMDGGSEIIRITGAGPDASSLR